MTLTLAGVPFQDDLFSYCNRVRRTILEVSLHAEECAAVMYGQDSVLYKYFSYYYVLEPILYSTGTLHENLHQSVVTVSGVTYFIPWANMGCVHCGM